MPDLVKVGFSTKDPHLRAAELEGTGTPHPFKVEFDLLTLNPRSVEQAVHKRLASHREAKEWFRCSKEQAISTVKEIAGVEDSSHPPPANQSGADVQANTGSAWLDEEAYWCPSCARANYRSLMHNRMVAPGVVRCGCGALIPS